MAIKLSGKDEMKGKPDIQKIKQVAPEVYDPEEIGSGGFKVVYKAQVKGKIEAVKLVQIPSDENDRTIRDENLRRIVREVDILAKCSSPYLVKLGSILPRECEVDEVEYVIYSEEYIPGETLRKMILAGQRPTKEDLAELAICTFKAVRELSGMNVIHRDIKPDNIIKSNDLKRPYILLDLGIAFQIGGTRLTRDSARIPGTLYYIAPEMLDQRFRQNLDYRADLYTIALTLYEFASGDNPFAHRDDPQFTTLYRIKTIKPRPLQEFRNDLPTPMCKLIDQLMRKIPALRPANIEQLIKQVEAYR
ncbi:MAG: serine/threonine protein kinase [Desulfobacterales bacterium]|uniref:non-specific serine/threonine protein kinase n=1 Tax=Candidatus Desulfatibia profunda TaxID=2841695 RepID=A0A8J6NNB3_9BACT|nr:serine/threonine protein kinase [Candidatus Desulfatibia profunda]MBL7181310.1 serine/threonine protein kinase [Desulfobacterales bacterium]